MLVGVLLFQAQEDALGFFVVLKEALTVELPVGARVRVGPRRQQVGGDVADPCDVGHHVDGFLGPETHRRDVESGRLIQRMSLDTPSGAGSDSCTLIWRRV